MKSHLDHTIPSIKHNPLEQFIIDNQVRLLDGTDGIWIVGSDMLKALGYGESSWIGAINRYCFEYKKMRVKKKEGGRGREQICIRPADVLHVILRSRMPATNKLRSQLLDQINMSYLDMTALRRNTIH